MFRVLILEDNVDDLGLVLRELKATGLELDYRHTDNFETYQNLIMHFHPDLVLADYALTGFDGHSALECLRRISPMTPFIVVSGVLNPQDAAGMLEKGAASYVMKDHLFRLRDVVTQTVSHKNNGGGEGQRIALESIATVREELATRPLTAGIALRVLMLEDEEDDAELVKRELNKSAREFIFHTVATEEAFSRALQEFQPDVILADFSLPSFDGLSALKLRQQFCPDVPYIFISSIMGEEVALETLSLGATDFVLKDRLARLIPVVERAVAESLERKALTHHQELIRSILDSSKDAILTVSYDGVIKTVNPAVRQVFARTPEELIGRSLQELIPSLNARELENLSSLNMRTHEKEFTAIRNGTEFPIDVSLSRIRVQDEQLFTALIRDITERRRLQEQLHEQISQLEVANERLEIANKQLEEARDRAQEASDLNQTPNTPNTHEIRTPMSGVLGMSELLMLSDTSDEVKQIATHIYECSKSLVCIVNDILDFSKLEAGKLMLDRVKFSLPKVIEQVVQSTSAAAQQKHIEIKVNIDPGIPNLVWGDDGRIRQALLNLVHNAIKFTNEGKVVIDVKKEKSANEISTLKILVSDTGIGISKTAMQRIFMPFTQADNSMTRRYGGTGLGLSICKSLVNLMSGEIGVESTEGKGSTFWISLPLQIAEETTTKNG